jgi:hypothetical protein
MERVETLCERLKEQLSQKAGIDDLMLTVQMLQAELLHLKSASVQEPAPVSTAIKIDIPPVFETTAPTAAIEETKEATPPPEEEKIIEVLQIDEAEVEAELEEIRKNAEARKKIAVQNKPPILFDPVEDTPTLIHQQGSVPKQPKELHETIGSDNDSLNDRLRSSQTELSDTLKDAPIKDLKKAIGINDRFLFISELFRGDEAMYERSIKTINGFSIFPEAEYWIRRELKLKLAWDDKNPVVKQFDQLVRRRFSAT